MLGDTGWVRLPVVVAAAAAAVVLAGCGGSGQPSGALSKGELRWVRDAVEWSDAFNARLFAAGRLQSGVLTDPRHNRGPYLNRLQVLERCPGELAEELGDPPSARLRPGAAALRTACREIARFAQADARSLRTLAPDDFLASQAAIAAGLNGLREARRRIGTLLLDARPLRRGAGLSGISRIDPALTAAAVDLVARDVEVRCWSPDDWERLVDELTAYTAGELTIDNTGAFASPESARVHFQAADCDALVDLAAGREVDHEDGRWALVAFTHELQHLVSEQSGEAATECAALQTAERVGVLLGIPAATSRRLLVDYLEHDYADLPDEYRSPACHDGGELDLHPGSARWP
jgi:hypothetical protein